MSVTQKWVSGQLKDLRTEMRQLLAEQYEKIGQLLVKHFYTKDETDRKLSHYATREELLNTFVTKQEFATVLTQTKEDLKSYIGVQVESLRSDFRAGLEGISLHSQKLANHETRITKLEEHGF